MDPNATLNELRALCARVSADQRLSQADVERGAELFTALDEWLCRDGFLPTDWSYLDADGVISPPR
ncbi:hypothetical protein KAYACHO_85 [Mycobacterium phage KayaCho]|uniref:HNH endonuclease n=1 Tax=Mycobacterium phage KayaCho TaxID=1340830 RepID=UPI000387E871|nr:HNH endonuclease [Mycobacterium phage KayaCho]AGT12989.1 hypothetical protein KAYACHO_85 [Mycobacterium phage KayaCho]